jgi:hypothetical protein
MARKNFRQKMRYRRSYTTVEWSVAPEPVRRRIAEELAQTVDHLERLMQLVPYDCDAFAPFAATLRRLAFCFDAYRYYCYTQRLGPFPRGMSWQDVYIEAKERVGAKYMPILSTFKTTVKLWQALTSGHVPLPISRIRVRVKVQRLLERVNGYIDKTREDTWWRESFRPKPLSTYGRKIVIGHIPIDGKILDMIVRRYIPIRTMGMEKRVGFLYLISKLDLYPSDVFRRYFSIGAYERLRQRHGKPVPVRKNTKYTTQSVDPEIVLQRVTEDICPKEEQCQSTSTSTEEKSS